MMLRFSWIALFSVLLVLGCGDDGGGGGAGAMSTGGSASGGTGGTGGSGGTGGTTGGSGGAAGMTGGSGGMTGGSGGMTGGSGGSGGSGGTTGGSGGMTGGSGGMTGGSGGSGGSEPPEECVGARAREEACPACENDEGCDAPAYTVNGDGTVTSSCCGLVFQQACDRMMEYEWPEAVAYCEGLTLAGGGWRLPTKEELFTLAIDGDPSLDPVAFPDEPLTAYWTSTPVYAFPEEHWAIEFWPGEVAFAAEERDEFPNFDVRCVR